MIDDGTFLYTTSFVCGTRPSMKLNMWVKRCSELLFELCRRHLCVYIGLEYGTFFPIYLPLSLSEILLGRRFNIALVPAPTWLSDSNYEMTVAMGEHSPLLRKRLNIPYFYDTVVKDLSIHRQFWWLLQDSDRCFSSRSWEPY